jgi:ABC-type lipoprotein release transport system permease subunit
MIQIIKMAFRDLGRNRRRSFFSSLALAMGLALLLLMAAFINGEMKNALDSNIRLQTGHIQVRASTYDEVKTSLRWEDLVENPDQVSVQIAGLEHVETVTPRLFASGILAVGDKSSGVRIIGVDPQSAANDPYRNGLLSGDFLQAEDREGILLGEPLAKKLGVGAGDQVFLSVNTSNGEVGEQSFIVRGVYSTSTYGFDFITVFLPLSKAQAITQTEKHASTIFVLLKDKQQTENVASVLKKNSGYQILTWTGMNELVLQTEELASSYMVMLYLIVLAVTATVIVNTLIMSVFERTREIGILSAIGMKSWRIMTMFLVESSLLAVGGIVMGLVMGILVVSLLGIYGFRITDMQVTGMLIGNTLYPVLTLNDTIQLTILTFVITILAGLYPAVIAARMEPVAALRGGK